MRGHKGHVERPLTEWGVWRSQGQQSQGLMAVRDSDGVPLQQPELDGLLLGLVNFDRNCFRSLALFFFESSKSQSESEEVYET